MADEDIGWFKVSRRVRRSSVWWKCPPPTFKVLMLLLDEAQSIDNMTPGEIHMGPTVIAGQCGLPLEVVNEALAALSREDPESQTREDKRTIEELPEGGGYRLVNFDRYHPEAAGRRGAGAIKRHIRAKKAAAARWSRGPESDGAEEVLDAETQRLVRPVMWPEGPAGPTVVPVLPRELDAREEAAVFGADVGAAAAEQRAFDGSSGGSVGAAGAPDVSGVPRVRGDAPSGLHEAAGGGVAVPAGPSVGASVGGVEGSGASCSSADFAAEHSLPSPLPPAPPTNGTVIDSLSGIRKPSFEPHPFIQTLAKRRDLERETYKLVGKIVDLTNLPPEEVFAKGTEWTDKRTGKKVTRVRAELMSNEHLLKTVMDLRARLESESKKARQA